MPTHSPSHWQNTLNPQLVQRLMRPIVQPGVIGSALADQIRSRSDRWSNRLPLLTQITQQHRLSEGSPAGQPPIVYAQPVAAEMTSESAAQPSTPSATRSDRPTVIQAKFASSAPTNHSTSPVIAPESAQRSLPSHQPVSLNTTNSYPTTSPVASENPSSKPSPHPLSNSFQHPSPQPSLHPLPILPIVQARSPVPTLDNDAIAPQGYAAPESGLPIVSAQPAIPLIP